MRFMSKWQKKQHYVMMKIKIIVSCVCVCMDNIYKSAKLKKKIHWSMKHKVVVKIVATGGETTWLFVCYLVLLCCF